jgi:hypothetical protein
MSASYALSQTGLNHESTHSFRRAIHRPAMGLIELKGNDAAALAVGN